MADLVIIYIENKIKALYMYIDFTFRIFTSFHTLVSCFRMLNFVFIKPA